MVSRMISDLLLTSDFGRPSNLLNYRPKRRLFLSVGRFGPVKSGEVRFETSMSDRDTIVALLITDATIQRGLNP